MQNKLFLSLALASGVVLTSCGKLGELSADNFTVTPSPLETVGSEVPVTINGRFPEKYMKKKAVVTVTPVLRYANGETVGQPATFQGEKVQGNAQEVSYKVGGNYTLKNSFDYVPEMAESELFLTFDARLGKKKVEVPEVKVANGVLSTSTLVTSTAKGANTALGTDAYQQAIAQSHKAQIKYLINQAKVRTSELKTVSVRDFVKMLEEIKADQKNFQLENIEVSAYASPDGALDFNTELAEKRQNTSSAFVQKELNKIDLNAKVDTKYTAEDWEGFKELVQASNIQDKDVILRVLSMYPDPEEREKQIRNLSAAFNELADAILPELRRARLTINYNLIGRSDSEIQSQFASDASKLSVEEMLYAATLTEDVAKKEEIYKATASQYPNDFRAFNNLAGIAINKGDLNAAKSYLNKAAAIKADAAEINANRALLALAEGNVAEAESYLSKATTAKNYNEVLGSLNVAKGNYAQAANDLKGTSTNSAALAQILNKDYVGAAQTLAAVETPDATTNYLKAVVAARNNEAGLVVSNLKKAISMDSSLKARAAKDLEFAKFANDEAFKALVK